MMRRLLGDCRGVLPIEFALVIPLMFALVLGVADVSRVLLAQNLVGQLAVELANVLKFETSPAARTSLSQETVEATLKGLSSDFAGGLIDPDQLTLSVSFYADLTALAAGMADGTGFGAAGELVAFRLDYLVPLVTPFASLLYDGGDVTRTAVVVVKNGR